MSIVKTVILLWFTLGMMLSLYNAGKYSSGHVETRKGIKWAFYNLIASFVTAVIAIALYFDW